MTRVFLALSLFALCAAPTAAQASSPIAAMMAADGNAILKALDKRASAFDDQAYTASMEIFKGGKKQKTLRFEMTMKGLAKQLIVFTAPGDVAGMKVLMQDADTLYVYSPEFKKVRRIAAHMQNQGFLGSTFTYEDMTQTLLSPTFEAKLKGKSGKETTLDLTPRAGKASTYDRLEVVIDASKGGVTKIRYYDGSGTLVREQLRENWKKLEGVLLPTKVTMKNLKTGDHTVVTLDDLTVNQGVSDDLFSRRTLMRG